MDFQVFLMIFSTLSVTGNLEKKDSVKNYLTESKETVVKYSREKNSKYFKKKINNNPNISFKRKSK